MGRESEEGLGVEGGQRRRFGASAGTHCPSVWAVSAMQSAALAPAHGLPPALVTQG